MMTWFFCYIFNFQLRFLHFTINFISLINNKVRYNQTIIEIYPILNFPSFNKSTLTPSFFSPASIIFIPLITIFFKLLLNPFCLLSNRTNYEVIGLLLTSITATKVLVVHFLIAYKAYLLLRLMSVIYTYFTVLFRVSVFSNDLFYIFLAFFLFKSI